jgi:tetratricopeptide (TPR) repeat protein
MAKPPSPDIAKAIALHTAGRLADARALYEKAFAENSRDTTAIHGLGLIAVDQGRPGEALPLFVRCIALDPQNAVFLTSYGLALLANGQAEDAAGHLLAAANRAPQFAEARIHLARALMTLQRTGQAFDVLADTVERFPDRADVWALKGTVERGLGCRADAEASLRRAYVLAPKDPDILNNLGAVLRDGGQDAQAVSFYRQALALAPDRAVTHANLGNTLGALRQLGEAEIHLRKAILLDPDSDTARLGLALLFAANEQPVAAIPLLREVLAHDPQNSDASANLGVALLACGDVAGAEAQYRAVLARDPQNAEAHYNLAWVLLLTGRWSEGWDHYEWRWNLKHFSSRIRGFSRAVWDGKPFTGTLLVHAEQGLGDAIQFGRLLGEARKRCTRLIFECHPPLVTLLKDLPGIDEITAAGTPAPAFTHHAPLMSLARVFGLTPDTIPMADSYLPARPRIRPELELPAAPGRKRVGLVWAGSPDNKIDRRRSFPARLFAPLFAPSIAGGGVDFVSLQIGPRSEEVRDLPGVVFDSAGKVADFSDTAAVIAQLDLVIGVDTAVMHLAGAMGRPAWLLIPFMPDYRWLLERNDTPWYSSIRLFRQQKNGDWPGVLAHVEAALSSWKGIGV